jgi:hypothetical protein
MHTHRIKAVVFAFKCCHIDTHDIIANITSERFTVQRTWHIFDSAEQCLPIV